MRLNDITCLNYAVGESTAAIALASTDLDAIKALTEAERLMLYDDSGNPLYELMGFERIVSIKVMLENECAEVVFARVDTAVKELQAENASLREQLAQRIAELEESSKTMKEAVEALQTSSQSIVDKLASLKDSSISSLFTKEG